MRKSTFFLIYVSGLTIFFCFLLVLHTDFSANDCRIRREDAGRLVREHGITDLCLFTEARYTRHISQADYHAPFQDHPMSMDHFPTGSIVYPPHRMERVLREMD